MKYIKQKSTGRTVFRDEPYSEHTLSNASLFLNIDKSDLIVVDEDISLDQYVKQFRTSLGWVVNRKQEYPPIADQLDKIYHDGIDAWKADMIKPVKAKYPKE